ncbi:MAG: PEP-CTERM sorting domain-containing protein [Chthonomonas sp.]|nr:PEP-CTERM sorting domain-containing protein [Chthonomonas sp.]
MHGDANSYVADIDFDSAGTLYAMTWYHRDFYTVSQTNAAIGFVSAGPHRDVTAMAIQAVPEPVTCGALALGLLGLLRRRR